MLKDPKNIRLGLQFVQTGFLVVIKICAWRIIYRWASFSNVSMRKSELITLRATNLLGNFFSQLYGLRIFSFLYQHSSWSPYSFLEKIQELSNRSPHFWSLASHICPTYAYKVNFLDPHSTFLWLPSQRKFPYIAKSISV